MPCLSQQTLRRLLTLATLTLLSATLALAQETPQPDNRDFAKNGTDNWSYAATLIPSHKKLVLVTMADPTHRHRCFVQSITADQLVCKVSFHQTRIYKPQDVAALTMSGDKRFKIHDLPELLFANAVAGAGAWGTIVLAPACPLCAAATAFEALVMLIVAGDIALPDDRPESLLYLAPGQTLQVKLRY
ncbi:MAG TPA: hypothetical protein VII58_06485 [Acidobacteriaceae bacterium]